jgi:hypothetical protein
MTRRAVRLAGVPAAAVLFAIVPVGDAAAKKVRLSEVAKEASRSSDEQEVLGREKPSQTKYKKKAPTAERPREVSSRKSSDRKVSIGVGWLGSAGTRWRGETRWRVGVVGGGAGLDDALVAIGSGGASVGVERGRLSFDLRGHYARGQFSEELRPGFHHLHGRAGDAVLRCRVATDARTEVNVMLLGRLGTYDWDFRNPVQVASPDGVRTVARDSISYRTFLAGFGVVPDRGRQWSLQLTGAAGYQRFDRVTGHDFENDVFKDGVVVEVLVELVYSPRWKRK